jgi:hypothetical protein
VIYPIKKAHENYNFIGVLKYQLTEKGAQQLQSF